MHRFDRQPGNSHGHAEYEPDRLLDGIFESTSGFWLDIDGIGGELQLLGDVLFVRKQETARTGEIVVAMIEGEATVKRYYPEGDRIRLQPSNPRLQPIYVRKADARSAQILGVAVGIFRNLE